LLLSEVFPVHATDNCESLFNVKLLANNFCFLATFFNVT
jgi:hypothetical protein